MSGHAQKPLFCQSDWCYTPAEKDGGVLVLRAILSFAVSFSFLAGACAHSKTVPPKTNSQDTTQAVGESSGRLPLAGSGLRELATENQELLLGKITLVPPMHSKCSPAPALH
jgi:hypothetical protein